MELFVNFVGSIRFAFARVAELGVDGAFRGHIAFPAFRRAADDNADDDNFSSVFEQATTEERPTPDSERHVEEEHLSCAFEAGDDNANDDQVSPVFELATTEERPTPDSERHVEEEHLSCAFEATTEERPTPISDRHVEEEHLSSAFEATTEERPTHVSESHVEEEHFSSVFEVGESSTRPLDDDEEEYKEDEDEEMEDPDSEEEYVISKSYNKQLKKMLHHYQTRSTTRTGTGTGTSSDAEMDDLNRPRTTTGTGTSSQMVTHLNTEEAPEVEPESMNAWNTFQHKRKGKKDSATIWNDMSPDEKLKYGKKLKYGEKKHKVTLVVQCKTNKFLDPLERLEPERLRMLEDSPFHKLLEIKRGVQNNKRIKQLALMFNTEERCIEIEGVKYVVTPGDFSRIMGVEDGEEEEEIKMPGRGAKKKSSTEAQEKSPNEAEKKLLAQLRRDFTNNGKVDMEKVEKQLRGGEEEDNVKRAYALLALSWIIRARGDLSGSFLNLVQNVSGLKKKRWATYAIENLVEGIKTLQNSRGNAEKYIGGCTIFLQLFAEKMIPKESLPFECDDKRRRKRKRDEDKTDERYFLDVLEALDEQVKATHGFIEKQEKKNRASVRYKDNPAMMNTSDVFFSKLRKDVDDMKADFPKTYEEYLILLRRASEEQTDGN